MKGFEFLGIVFTDRRAMIHFIVEEWVSGGESMTAQRLADVFGTRSDAEIATGCIKEWGLDCAEGRVSHMVRHGYDREDLVAAFSSCI